MTREISNSRRDLGRFLNERLAGALALLLVMLICAVMTWSVGWRRFIKSMETVGIHALRASQQPYPIDPALVGIADQLQYKVEN